MPDGPLSLDIVFDAICPWCFIGKRRVEQALALRPGLKVALRWHPFLLNPQMPQEGASREVYLAKKFGEEARVQRILNSISEAGRMVGIDFDFNRIERTPNTINAHRLVLYAEGHGLADQAVEALFQAYFLEGRNTGETEVLIDICSRLGLESDRLSRILSSHDEITTIYEENARAHRLGINGVPSFLLAGHLTISGAQEPQVLVRVLDVAARMRGTATPPFSGNNEHMSRPEGLVTKQPLRIVPIKTEDR